MAAKKMYSFTAGKLVTSVVAGKPAVKTAGKKAVKPKAKKK